MIAKLILVLAGAAAVAWYGLVGGKKVDEDKVQAMYRDYMSAFDRGDAKAVCDFFHEKLTGEARYQSHVTPAIQTLNKAKACAAVDEFRETKQKLEAQVGQELYTNLEMTVQSVNVAVDKKSAEVEVLLEMRIGTEQRPLLDARSTQRDVVKANWGKLQFVESHAVVKYYQ
jgi:hypothetical protein